MKTLIAEKVKDGWYVQITDTLLLSCESNVFKVAREHGLKVDTELLKLQGDKIVAR